MGIDVTELKEEHFLERLGEADWAITLPNNYPDLIVTRAWRDELEREMASDFVRWVLSGIDIKINHDNDPDWDASGDARRYQADSLLLLTRYESIADWLDNAHTGNSKASYVSGMGIFWETYKEKQDDDIQEAVYALLKSHVKPLQSNFEEDDDDYWEEAGYEEVSLVDICLQWALQLWMRRLTTAEVWKAYEASIRAEILEEEYEASIQKAENAYITGKIRAFWEAYFKDIADEKLEMPQFEAQGLEKRLRDLFADADPELLSGIVKFGLPAVCSNSVRTLIASLAKEALND